MTDALLSPAMGGIMLAVSAGSIAYSVIKTRSEHLEEKKIPIMGVMGAFVFAAQMINFTIPGTGSSGHIGGGILLAALLGPFPAFLTITTVLMIQALFFADGGLLALGCNIFNMGFISCFIAYPLLFKPLLKKQINGGRLMLASILAVVIGLQLGAFSVVLETLFSGITELPFGQFLALMQPIHLAIGLVEGIATGAVLYVVFKARPELMESSLKGGGMGNISTKKLLIGLVVATLFVGGCLSLFASSYPDGLEWSLSGVAGTTELEADAGIHGTMTNIQQTTAFLPDYGFKNPDEKGSTVGTSTSGIVGSVLTLSLAALTGWGITAHRKKKRSTPGA